MIESQRHMLLSPRDLAKRWGRSDQEIRLASAVGVGPRYLKIDGQIMYPADEVQRYERACMFNQHAEVALQEVH
jgi:hypothetical protein